VEIFLNYQNYEVITCKNKKTNKNMKSGLLKISQLAKQVGVLSSTINYYTNEGLLKAEARTQGGYRLYKADYAIKQIKQIQKLQFDKRLRIDEIKKVLK